VYYKPGPTEKMIAWIISVAAGLVYLAVIARCQGNGLVDSAVDLVVGFFEALILGYFIVALFQTAITRQLMNSIAKLKARQIQVIVEEKCGEEISVEEAVELWNKITGRDKKTRATVDSSA